MAHRPQNSGYTSVTLTTSTPSGTASVPADATSTLPSDQRWCGGGDDVGDRPTPATQSGVDPVR